MQYYATQTYASIVLVLAFLTIIVYRPVGAKFISSVETRGMLLEGFQAVLFFYSIAVLATETSSPTEQE